MCVANSMFFLEVQTLWRVSARRDVINVINVNQCNHDRRILLWFILVRFSQAGVKMIALRCAGFDRVDLKAAEAHGITVARVPAYSHSAALIFVLNHWRVGTCWHMDAHGTSSSEIIAWSFSEARTIHRFWPADMAGPYAVGEHAVALMCSLTLLSTPGYTRIHQAPSPVLPKDVKFFVLQMVQPFNAVHASATEESKHHAFIPQCSHGQLRIEWCNDRNLVRRKAEGCGQAMREHQAS